MPKAYVIFSGIASSVSPVVVSAEWGISPWGGVKKAGAACRRRETTILIRGGGDGVQ